MPTSTSHPSITGPRNHPDQVRVISNDNALFCRMTGISEDSLEVMHLSLFCHIYMKEGRQVGVSEEGNRAMKGFLSAFHAPG